MSAALALVAPQQLRLVNGRIDLDAIRLMAEMGAGVAILPSLYALSEARLDRGLNARLIDHPLARREISLIWRDTSPLEASLKELAAPLRSAAAKLLRYE